MGGETFLRDLRDQVKAFTEADPYFSAIEILNEELKDMINAVDMKLSTLGGISILLVTPIVGGVLANVGGANFKDIKVVARILENVDLNDTGRHALDVAIYLAALWSQARPDTFSSSLVPEEPTITLGNDPKFLSYDVQFSTESGTKITIPRLAAVTTNASDLGSVTLAHAMPGAAIFHTLDGTPPVPRNPSASLFLAPFTATAGQVLRTRAWLAGYIPSPETRQTL